VGGNKVGRFVCHFVNTLSSRDKVLTKYDLSPVRNLFINVVAGQWGIAKCSDRSGWGETVATGKPAPDKGFGAM
jgi:hypothetical protein